MPDVKVYLSVVVETDRYPVPDDEMHHVLSASIGVLADLLADGAQEVAIDRIEPTITFQRGPCQLHPFGDVRQTGPGGAWRCSDCGQVLSGPRTD